jgi:hypothetical protein
MEGSLVMGTHSNSDRGLPVFEDPERRPVVDPTIENSALAWYPANAAAHKLWRCHECLRDIDNLLRGSKDTERSSILPRRVKLLTTPLYSLIEALHELIHGLRTDPDSIRRLGGNQLDALAKLDARLLQDVPTSSKGALKAVRSKAAAHIDKHLLPHQLRDIVREVDAATLLAWVHHALIVMLELLEFDVYGWTVEDNRPGIFRLMSVEPWLVTFAMEDGTPERIVDLSVARSPRFDIADLIRSIVHEARETLGEESGTS